MAIIHGSSGKDRLYELNDCIFSEVAKEIETVIDQCAEEHSNENDKSILPRINLSKGHRRNKVKRLSHEADLLNITLLVNSS